MKTLDAIENLRNGDFKTVGDWAFENYKSCKNVEIPGSADMIQKLADKYISLVSACEMNDDGETDNFEEWKKSHCIEIFKSIMA